MKRHTVFVGSDDKDKSVEPYVVERMLEQLAKQDRREERPIRPIQGIGSNKELYSDVATMTTTHILPGVNSSVNATQSLIIIIPKSNGAKTNLGIVSFVICTNLIRRPIFLIPFTPFVLGATGPGFRSIGR
jgi:hypothetical protein